MTSPNNIQIVVVLGASNKPQRFSYKAIQRLKQYGHTIIPIHPKLKIIEEIAVLNSLSEVSVPVDTLTLYVGPQRSEALIDDIIRLHPKRVIFNPGTRSDVLEKRLKTANIIFIHDCTLVMLDSNNF